jgi:hypothetical protein
MAGRKWWDAGRAETVLSAGGHCPRGPPRSAGISLNAIFAPCAGYLGHLFTKSEIYASTTSLVSYIVFKKMYLLGKVRAGEFTFDKYAFVYFD